MSTIEEGVEMSCAGMAGTGGGAREIQRSYRPSPGSGRH